MTVVPTFFRGDREVAEIDRTVRVGLLLEELSWIRLEDKFIHDHPETVHVAPLRSTLAAQLLGGGVWMSESLLVRVGEANEARLTEVYKPHNKGRHPLRPVCKNFKKDILRLHVVVHDPLISQEPQSVRQLIEQENLGV